VNYTKYNFSQFCMLLFLNKKKAQYWQKFKK
jgi:hypothetical protein